MSTFGRALVAGHSKPTRGLHSVCDRSHCSLPLLPLVLKDPPTVDSGLPVPANSVIIQAVIEVMAVKGKRCFVREQRQG